MTNLRNPDDGMALAHVRSRPVLTRQRRLAVQDPADMKDHVYKILELVGSSEESIEDAIQNAITRASKTIRGLKWFEVVQARGHIEDGSVRHYQVALRVGFTLEG
jgi:flavin-binding protein dodecin